ncbi:MAG: serine hydrolase [Myxococcota bacterium]
MSDRSRTRGSLHRPSFRTIAVFLLAATLQMNGCAHSTQLSTVSRIPELREAYQVQGLAVTAVAGEQIILAEGFGMTSDDRAYTSTTPCGLYSATKVLASLTYAKLAQEKRIRLDAPLGEYLSDSPEDWKDIPFFRLLNHSSGLSIVVDKPEFAALASNPDAKNEQIYRMLKGAPLDYAPGQFSRYRQSGYVVGEVILRDQLGVSFSDLIEQYVTTPAGMLRTVHSSKNEEIQPSIILSAGGYETTAEDMARLFLGINRGTIIEPSDWKTLLLDEKYLFDDYSLGSVIENRKDVLTLGHSGGGARANVRYAPNQRVGVMVCTDDRQNNLLALTLARMLVDEIVSGQKPKTPLFVALSQHQSWTGAEVVAAYERAAQEPERFDLSDSEPLLNGIGYSFLEREKAADAINVFSLNTRLHPKSANTNDSLGEALLAAGAVDEALAQYRKVLALDPGNAHATGMIEKIEARLGR